MSKDPLMRIKRNVRSPTIQLGQTDEKDEDEDEIRMVKPCSSRKTTAKSDPKGKNVASSPEKAKKNKELQIGEVPKRKRKLLSVAKVHL